MPPGATPPNLSEPPTSPALAGPMPRALTPGKLVLDFAVIGCSAVQEAELDRSTPQGPEAAALVVEGGEAAEPFRRRCSGFGGPAGHSSSSGSGHAPTTQVERCRQRPLPTEPCESPLGDLLRRRAHAVVVIERACQVHDSSSTLERGGGGEEKTRFIVHLASSQRYRFTLGRSVALVFSSLAPLSSVLAKSRPDQTQDQAK